MVTGELIFFILAILVLPYIVPSIIALIRGLPFGMSCALFMWVLISQTLMLFSIRGSGLRAGIILSLMLVLFLFNGILACLLPVKKKSAYNS